MAAARLGERHAGCTAHQRNRTRGGKSRPSAVGESSGQHGGESGNGVDGRLAGRAVPRSRNGLRDRSPGRGPCRRRRAGPQSLRGREERGSAAPGRRPRPPPGRGQLDQAWRRPAPRGSRPGRSRYRTEPRAVRPRSRARRRSHGQAPAQCPARGDRLRREGRDRDGDARGQRQEPSPPAHPEPRGEQSRGRSGVPASRIQPLQPERLVEHALRPRPGPGTRHRETAGRAARRQHPGREPRGWPGLHIHGKVPPSPSRPRRPTGASTRRRTGASDWRKRPTSRASGC